MSTAIPASATLDAPSNTLSGRPRRRPLWLRTGIIAAALYLLVTVLAALFPAFFAPHDPYAVHIRSIMTGPSAEHLLGTDEAGRDVLSRLIYGARTSLTIGVGATVIGVAAGSFFGILAGLGPKWMDTLIMRAVDCLVAVPDILLALIVITLVGGGTTNTLIAVGIASIPGYARIMRAQTHQVRVAPFIESAKILGLNREQVAFRHVFPNAFRPLISVVALRMGGAIGAGAGLSFLGLGAPPPQAEWGAMISTARNFLLTDPLLVLWPALALTFTVVAVTVLARELKQRLEGRSL